MVTDNFYNGFKKNLEHQIASINDKISREVLDDKPDHRIKRTGNPKYLPTSDPAVKDILKYVEDKISANSSGFAYHTAQQIAVYNSIIQKYYPNKILSSIFLGSHYSGIKKISSSYSIYICSFTKVKKPATKSSDLTRLHNQLEILEETLSFINLQEEKLKKFNGEA